MSDILLTSLQPYTAKNAQFEASLGIKLEGFSALSDLIATYSTTSNTHIPLKIKYSAHVCLPVVGKVELN